MAREDYEQYKKLLLQLHEMNRQGTDQTDEADVIRDQMDAPGYRLNEKELERVNGLSADLYMLTGEEILESPDLPDIDIEFSKAYKAKDWDRVLEILRKRDPQLQAHLVAKIRILCWSKLGDNDVALLFAEHALKLKPDDAEYRRSVEILRGDFQSDTFTGQISSPKQLSLNIPEMSLLQPA